MFPWPFSIPISRLYAFLQALEMYLLCRKKMQTSHIKAPGDNPVPVNTDNLLPRFYALLWLHWGHLLSCCFNLWAVNKLFPWTSHSPRWHRERLSPEPMGNNTYPQICEVHAFLLSLPAIQGFNLSLIPLPCCRLRKQEPLVNEPLQTMMKCLSNI